MVAEPMRERQGGRRSGHRDMRVNAFWLHSVISQDCLVNIVLTRAYPGRADGMDIVCLKQTETKERGLSRVILSLPHARGRQSKESLTCGLVLASPEGY